MTYQQALLAHLLRTNEQQVASCDAFVALPSAETDAERAQWSLLNARFQADLAACQVALHYHRQIAE